MREKEKEKGKKKEICCVESINDWSVYERKRRGEEEGRRRKEEGRRGEPVGHVNEKKLREREREVNRKHCL